MSTDREVVIQWAKDMAGASLSNPPTPRERRQQAAYQALADGLTANNPTPPPPPDTTAPKIVVPTDITVASTSTGGAVVTYTVSCDDPEAIVTTSPPSGQTFPVGTSTVAVTATDKAGNKSLASFHITVNPFVPPPPIVTPFPTPANTGVPVGTTLTAYTGPSNITVDGTVIDGKDVSTVLKITAKNVTIKNSRIKASGTYGINQLAGASGLVITDVEITSTDPAGSANGDTPVGMIDRAVLLHDSATITRLYAHATWRGVQFSGTTGVKILRDSYVGDNVNPSGNHTSAANTDGGTSHVVIDHCTLRTAPNTHASSAISMYPQLFAGGANDDWTFTNNQLDTAGGYAVYLGHSAADGESANTNIKFTGNRFGTLYYQTCGQYGPVASWDRGGGNVWSDNAYTDGRVVAEP